MENVPGESGSNESKSSGFRSGLNPEHSIVPGERIAQCPQGGPELS
jgi:hypothetical protein